MLGPGAQLSGAQLSALKKWTVGPPGQLGPGEMYKINWHLFPKCGQHISNIYIKGAQKTSNWHTSPKCWPHISDTNIYVTKCTFPSPAPEGCTEDLQLTCIPQNVGTYMPVGGFLWTLWVGECTFCNIYLYWISTANIWGVLNIEGCLYALRAQVLVT